MEGLGVGDIRTEAREAWLFDRIVTTGSVVLSAVGGSEAGTAAAHRYLSSPHTSVGAILRAFGARTAQACAGRAVVAVQDTSEINVTPPAEAARWPVLDEDTVTVPAQPGRPARTA